MNALHCIASIALATLAAGCYIPVPEPAQPATRSVAASQAIYDQLKIDSLDAICFPPQGWKMEKREGSDVKEHLVWKSPSGHTAYGVTRFDLPFKLPANWLVGFFLDEMKRKEGEATLIGQVLEDPHHGGVKLVARGGRYLTRVSITVKGTYGWAIYAGTLTTFPIEEDQLELAQEARRRTQTLGK